MPWLVELSSGLLFSRKPPEPGEWFATVLNPGKDLSEGLSPQAHHPSSFVAVEIS
jgi:hypothetical protein